MHSVWARPAVAVLVLTLAHLTEDDLDCTSTSSADSEQKQRGEEGEIFSSSRAGLLENAFIWPLDTET